MRKNFGAKPFTYPQPVFIIAAYDENGTAVSSNNATYYLTIIKETNGHLNHYSIVLKDADGDSIDTLDLKTAIPRTADEKKENS